MTNASATQRVAPGNVNDDFNDAVNGLNLDKGQLETVQHFAKILQQGNVKNDGAALEKDGLAIDTESTSDGGSDLSADSQGLIIEPATVGLPQSESVETFYDLLDDDPAALDWFPP